MIAHLIEKKETIREKIEDLEETIEMIEAIEMIAMTAEIAMIAMTAMAEADSEIAVTEENAKITKLKKMMYYFL
jgi:hypothetical protein